jgi:hypothetical protein
VQQPQGNPYAAYMNAATQATVLPYQMANQQLGYDFASAGIARNYDWGNLQNNYWGDSNRLNNAQYRDVDLARWYANQQLAQAGRNLDTTNTLADRGRYTAYTNAGASRDTVRANASQRFSDVQFTANRAFGIDTGRLADQLGLAGRDRTLGLQRAQLGYDQQGRALGNDAAQRGAATSTGYGEARGDLLSQLNLDRGGIANTYDRALSDNRWGNEQATLTRDASLRGGQTAYDSAIRDSDTAYGNTTRNAEDDYYGTTRRAADDYAAEQDRNARDNAMIDSVASDYGVTREEMRVGLELGLRRLGLDYGNTIGKITQAMQGNNVQAQAAAQAFMQQILLAAQQGTGMGSGAIPVNGSGGGMTTGGGTGGGAGGFGAR